MIVHIHTSPFTFTPHQPNAGTTVPLHSEIRRRVEDGQARDGVALEARVEELLHGRPVGLVDVARAFEGGDERVGKLGGDVAAGGERGVALVESQHSLLSGHEWHDRCHLTCHDELHASGCVHEVQSGRESSGEPLGYLPPSDGGREKKA